MATKIKATKAIKNIPANTVTAYDFQWRLSPELTQFTVMDGKPNPNGLKDYKEALDAFIKEETSRIKTLLSATEKESVFTPFEAWAKALVSQDKLENLTLVGDSTEKEKSGVQSLKVSDHDLLVKSAKAFLAEVTNGVYSTSGKGQKGAKGLTHRHKGSIHNIKGDNDAIEVVGFVNLIARDKTGSIQRMQDVLIAAVDDVSSGGNMEATMKCLSQSKYTKSVGTPVDVQYFFRIVNAGVRARQKNRAMSLLANAEVAWQAHATTKEEVAQVTKMKTAAPKARAASAAVSATV